MSQILAKEADGVALAAPQIGVSLRLFIVSTKIFAFDKKEDKPKMVTEDLVFINPRITRLSQKKVWLEEGCLSVRFQYGKMKRAAKVTVEAEDRNGQKFTWNGSGIMAQVFQHEIDHLDGILFTDKAIDIKEVKPEDLYDHSK